MLSYEKKCELARHFITNTGITEDKEQVDNRYIVEDIDKVKAVYIENLEGLTDEDGQELYDNSGHDAIERAISAHFEGESIGEFLDRYNIKWE